MCESYGSSYTPPTPDFYNLLTLKIVHGNVMNLNMLP
jgi:hypothetical protein